LPSGVLEFSERSPGLFLRLAGELHAALAQLPIGEGLIGRHLEAELLGVELERPRLIPGRNPDELDVRDHG
jgi:hypothetical protein